MMQATDFWDGDDSSDAAMLNRAAVGAILIERKMRARALVVVDVRGQDAAQMALVEDHDVIQTRTDHALDVCVLPRGAWRRYDFRDAHRLDPAAEVRAVRRVTVTEQIARRGVLRECFGYLAREPGGGRMLGDGGAYDTPSIVGQNDHHVEQPKRRGRHNEHIDRSDALGLIAQEAAPGRGRHLVFAPCTSRRSLG
jgi:hypothetical protein